jgi:hypothetical protein
MIMKDNNLVLLPKMKLVISNRFHLSQSQDLSGGLQPFVKTFVNMGRESKSFISFPKIEENESCLHAVDLFA